MRFFVAPLALAAACISAAGASPAAMTARDVDLGTWLLDSVSTFFPNHVGWETGYDAAFAPTVKATFNQPAYNFFTLKQLYTSINSQITTGFTSFGVNITSVVVVPNAHDLGGLVTLTGVEGGPLPNGTVLTAPDSVFAVVSEIFGRRYITEWRETTDFPL
ncbi:hypothetical protein FA95DRAFT_1674598 [Auriscalpium vulgare]|uniref:Uncharacterized protein n=1 Tax=Auriscalpium vulgare TaxID=40419 RepID=A0ACB8SAK9_9AGAM|nr:hypothetical protein FA95DRAFT_1674598 [Auriscalpium vulgare]